MKPPIEQAKDFSLLLRDELVSMLPTTFKVFGRKPLVRRKRQAGHDLLIIFNRVGPSFEKGEFLFSFIPGRSFETVHRINRIIGAQGTWAQIQQFPSRLCGLVPIPPHTPVEWSVNVYDSAADLARKMAEAAPLVAEPFFQRFTTLVAARDALVGEDPWCVGGHMAWANVLMLDIALGDVDRFRNWSVSFSEPVRQQAEYLISLYKDGSAA